LLQALDGLAEVVALDRAALDLGDPDAIRRVVREARPAVILNAGAYTAVDRAETEPDAAHRVNGVAPGVLGEEARRAEALVVHFSTDYVFDGTKSAPYVETDATNPLGVYGRTKLEGEGALADSGAAHVILRTSWVYAPHGKNFLLTMLRLAATRDEVRVVDDQRGAPTSARQLATAVAGLFLGGRASRPIEAVDLARVRGMGGLYHATAEGEASWFEFAQAIFAERSRRPGAGFSAPRVVAIPTSEYPTPARRPRNSRLSCDKLHAAFGIRLGPWQAALGEALSAVA
jgi:dTDP-4-dehydrorhamnose reductase